jgi:hypothetical protein
MTWVVHSDWLERQFDGTQALDLDSAAGGSTINMGIVTESSINPDTNNLFTGLTAVGTGTGWSGPVALSNITCGLNGSNNLVFDADDPAVIAQDAGSGFSNGRSLVLYETTNNFIIAHHTEAAAFGNVSGTITITLDANGIWVLTI